MGIVWSKEEVKLLRKFYPLYRTKVSREDLENLFPGRTWQSIQRKAEAENIKIQSMSPNIEFMHRLDKAVRNI